MGGFIDCVEALVWIFAFAGAILAAGYAAEWADDRFDSVTLPILVAFTVVASLWAVLIVALRVRLGI